MNTANMFSKCGVLGKCFATILANLIAFTCVNCHVSQFVHFGVCTIFTVVTRIIPLSSVTFHVNICIKTQNNQNTAKSGVSSTSGTKGCWILDVIPNNCLSVQSSLMDRPNHPSPVIQSHSPHHSFYALFINNVVYM
jgi:hypothetical protein